MTTSMTASATPSSNVGRGDEISLRIGFTLDNDRVSEAATYEYWTYDLSAVVGEGQTILSLNDGDTGNLYEGSSVRGYYVVDGTMLKLFVDEEWLNSGLQNVSGTFNLSAKLNEEKNQSQDEATIPLPGTTGVKITFEDRTLNSTKKVGVTADALSEKNDGGIVQVIDNGDGTYTLYYSISVKPNTDQSKLSVSDLLGGGQMLNVESLKLNGQPADFAIAQYGNGFMLDLGPTKRDTEYVITYSTTISSEELGKNQTNEATWSWDGEQQKDSTNVKPSYDRILEGSKKVGADQYYLRELNDGTVVTLTEKNEDGTYNIVYQLDFKPNKPSSKFTINDTMTGGQKLNEDSLQVLANGNLINPRPTVETTESSFTVYLNVEANVNYTIKYKTTVTEEQIEAAIHQKNSATAKWDGDDVTVNTDIVPAKKVEQMEISKSYISGVENQKVKVGDTVEYKIVIGKDGGLFDYAGMTVEDSVNTGQKQYVEYIADSFSINPNIGGTAVPDEGPGPKLFTYTFPDDQEYTGKYEITYKVRIKDDAPAGLWINNKGKVGQGPGAKESSTGVQIKGANPVTIAKEATEWDLENNTIYWTITITVPEGTTLNAPSSNPFSDYDAKISADKYLNDGSSTTSRLSIKGSQAEITYEDGAAVSAEVVSMNDEGKIAINGLTKTIKIKVPTVADVNLSELASKYGIVYAVNSAGGNIDNVWTSVTANDQYAANEYEMTKTGTIDKNGVASWTVVLNPRKIGLYPDHVPYFKDTLPAGMELVDGKIKIVASDRNPDSNDSEREETVTPSDGVIGPIALNQFNGYAYEGLSGISYTITYQTKLTDEEMAKVQSTKDTYTYTNIVPARSWAY